MASINDDRTKGEFTNHKVRAAINALITMGTYTSAFEPAFLASTEAYMKAVSQ
jgi:hypothetical protein